MRPEASEGHCRESTRSVISALPAIQVGQKSFLILTHVMGRPPNLNSSR